MPYSNTIVQCRIYKTLDIVNSNIHWDKIKEFIENLFSMIDVKDKPADIPPGFIIIGGVIVSVMLVGAIMRLLAPKEDMRTVDGDELYPVLHLKVSENPQDNQYLSLKELYIWMSIHNIPKATRVLFLTWQQIPFLRDIPIHRIYNVQEVDYILCFHFPGSPSALRFDNERYFFIPEEDFRIEDEIFAQRIILAYAFSSDLERKHAGFYLAKLETIYNYEIA